MFNFMSARNRWLVVLVGLWVLAHLVISPIVLPVGIPASPLNPRHPSDAITRDDARLQTAFGQLPLAFIANQGQVTGPVAYYLPGQDKTLYFTSEGVTFALAGTHEQKSSDTELDFVHISS